MHNCSQDHDDPSLPQVYLRSDSFLSPAIISKMAMRHLEDNLALSRLLQREPPKPLTPAQKTQRYMDALRLKLAKRIAGNQWPSEDWED